MFYQQAKPRAGVAKILSGGEKLFVTTIIFYKGRSIAKRPGPSIARDKNAIARRIRNSKE